ncbi:unnamed protein product [Tilletia controversa]|uniref:Uncharacterized protein n=3 Tax=Tilletia TaxID=13289 RepID=A0A8X7MPV4_9BASI|nr:hypothetical protein CF336_g5225 [Tilletia laevis]KAE8193282.1 hypothetical protein CF328_g5093 [Tilletia controversa]CAD6888840.1 unnamed protein product [Tilletia caries]KAE8198602.1 hypothetical protein CF335_g4351 [Tilletia laevis]KAE8245204.1 hypothetical protein A4X06_0g5784 [Tilletia controversa]
MSFSRFITSLVLGAAMVAAAAVSTSGTSIQHNFQAGSGGYNGDYVSEDINGVVDKLGKVSGNAKLLWKDDFIASSSSLKVFDSNLQAFTISRVDDEAYAAANTTT